MTDRDIAATADPLVVAQKRLAAAQTALAMAQDARSDIVKRMGDVDAPCQSIIKRRLGGTQHTTNDAGLVILDADKDGLAEVLIERDAAVAAARAVVEQAERAYSAVQWARRRLEALRAEEVNRAGLEMAGRIRTGR